MIKKLTIPVDHGNRNMKTPHFLFTTGLSSTDRKPAGREDFLQTDGKYYVERKADPVSEGQDAG